MTTDDGAGVMSRQTSMLLITTATAAAATLRLTNGVVKQEPTGGDGDDDKQPDVDKQKPNFGIYFINRFQRPPIHCLFLI